MVRRGDELEVMLGEEATGWGGGTDPQKGNRRRGSRLCCCREVTLQEGGGRSLGVTLESQEQKEPGGRGARGECYGLFPFKENSGVIEACCGSLDVLIHRVKHQSNYVLDIKLK